MSCPTSDCVDSLCQIAPHIIIDEHVQPCSQGRPHQGLYHRMILKEREVIEHRRRRRIIRLAQVVVATVRDWHTHPEGEGDSETDDPLDPEEVEAEMLAEAAKKHALAAAYNKGASGTHLKQTRASLARGIERQPEELQLHKNGEMKMEIHDLPPLSTGVEREIHKDGIVITVWFPHASDLNDLFAFYISNVSNLADPIHFAHLIHLHQLPRIHPKHFIRPLGRNIRPSRKAPPNIVLHGWEGLREFDLPFGREERAVGVGNGYPKRDVRSQTEVVAVAGF
ncbi:MAG: hypothetical protein Q9212_003493 [Teloschistes hypoglaucus]